MMLLLTFLAIAGSLLCLLALIVDTERRVELYKADQGEER